MKYALLLIVSLSSLFSFAQSKKFTFKLGEEYELPKKTEDLAFFGNQKDGIVNLALKKEEMNIVRFNPKTLSKTMEEKIDLDVTRNFTSEIVTDFSNSNQYYWIHSDWDKKAEKEMLFYDKMDIGKGKIAESNHKMFETTKMGGDVATMGIYSYKLTNKYQFDYDADRKKLLVTYRLSPEFKNDKKNYDKLGFQIFDEKLEKLWGGEFTMPYTEAIMDNSDFSVDGYGNAYLLAKIYNTDSRKETDKETGLPAYHFEIFKFTKDNPTPTIAKVSIDNNYIRSTTLIENPAHEMVIACTYSKKSKGSGTDGIFLAILDKEGKIVKYKNGYYEFPKAELEKFETARTKRKMEKKNDYENPNLMVRDVIVEPDGSIFIDCEEFWLKDNSGFMGGRYEYRWEYHYEDIYAAKISAKGDFLWIRKIPKRQAGEIESRVASFKLVNGMSSNALGFKLINDSLGYYFLYLDNIHNMNLREDEQPKYHVNGAGGQVVVSKIDNTGVVTKELVFDTREEDIMIYPQHFKKINGNQFIGRARIKKKLFQPVMIATK